MELLGWLIIKRGPILGTQAANTHQKNHEPTIPPCLPPNRGNICEINNKDTVWQEIFAIFPAIRKTKLPQTFLPQKFTPE